MTSRSALYVQNPTNFLIMDSGWAAANKVLVPQNFAAGADNLAVRYADGTGPNRLISRDPEVRTMLAAFEGHWTDAP